MKIETSQKLITKKASQCKACLMAGAFVLSLSMAATSTHAYFETQNFFSTTTQSGGIVTFQDTNPNELTITFDNTSNFSAIITGIVFNITQDIQGASILSFQDGLGTDLSSLWTVNLNVDNETTPGNTEFDVGFETITGITGGIYNNGTAVNTDNAFPDIATLVLSITNPVPWTFSDVADDSILRTQRTGEDGEGSDKIVTSSSSSSGIIEVSEPEILALLGLGLLAQAFVLMTRRRRLGI